MMEFVFDPIFEVLDLSSVKEQVQSTFSKASGGFLDFYMLPLVEHSRNPNVIISNDIFTNHYLSSLYKDAVVFWRREGMLKKIGPSPAKIKYVDVRSKVNGEIMLNSSANQVSDVFTSFGNSIDPYEIARILSWKIKKRMKLTVLTSLLQESMKLDNIFYLDQFENYVLPFISENCSVKEGKAILREQYLPFLEACKIKTLLGYKNQIPDDEEVSFYKTWTSEYKLTYEDIKQRTKDTAGSDPSFQYLNGILRNSQSNINDSYLQDEFVILSETLHLPKKDYLSNKALYVAIRKEFPYVLISYISNELLNKSNKPVSLLAVYKELSKLQELSLDSIDEIVAYRKAEEEARGILERLNSEIGLNIPINQKNLRTVIRWKNTFVAQDDDILAIAKKIPDPVKPMRYLEVSLRNLYKERKQDLADMMNCRRTLVTLVVS